MATILSYKGYTASIVPNLVSDMLVGEVLFIKKTIRFEAENLTQLRERFKNSIDDYIGECRRKGGEPEKTFSGTFNVRIGEELHRRSAEYAVRNNQSLNEFIKIAVETYLDSKSLT